MTSAIQNASSPVPSPLRQLIPLTAAQVMQMWDQLCYHIVLSMPLDGWSEEKAMVAINRGLLTVWAYCEGSRLLAALTTHFGGDAVLQTNYLIIYTASGAEALELEDWQTMIETLRDFCKESGYTKVVAYSTVDHVVDLINQLGGNTEQRYCELPVEAN